MNSVHLHVLFPHSSSYPFRPPSSIAPLPSNLGRMMAHFVQFASRAAISSIFVLSLWRKTPVLARLMAKKPHHRLLSSQACCPPATISRPGSTRVASKHGNVRSIWRATSPAGARAKRLVGPSKWVACM